jgi:hypothetical protein
MKSLFIPLLFGALSFCACKKENPQPMETQYLRASIKFTAPYVEEHFNNGVDSLFIQVEGQVRFSFKTYLHVCNSRSFGYVLKSTNESELKEFAIYADNKLVEVGFINFNKRDIRLIK